MKIRLALASLVAAGAVVLPAAAAHADAPCVPGASCTAPPVAVLPISGSGFSPSQVLGTAAVKVAPASVAPVSAPSQSLPFTGGDVAGLTAAGLGLLGAGLVLVRRNRVQPAEARS